MSHKFKPGSRVRCINAADSFNRLGEALLYVVDHATDTAVKLVDNYGYWPQDRFEIISTPKFQVGDLVRCIDGSDCSTSYTLKHGYIYTVAPTSANSLADNLISLVENEGVWDIDRFELVQQSLSPPPPFKQELQDLIEENNRLKAFIALSPLPCLYCGLTLANWSKCALGFPGCGRADDAALTNASKAPGTTK